MAKVSFAFKDKLDAVVGGEHHSFCFQCGACVGDCPAARYSDRFSPKTIVLMAQLGLDDELLGPGSMIWECTNCNNCYERCPQDVRPVEVIIALKNLSTRMGTAPGRIGDMVAAVGKAGRTTVVTDATNKIRKKLGLEEAKFVPLDELRAILGDGDGGGGEA